MFQTLLLHFLHWSLQNKRLPSALSQEDKHYCDIFKQHTWTHQKYKSVRIRQRPHDCLNVWLLHNCTNVYIIVRMLTYKKVPMSTKRSLILQKVQLLHNCTSVYIIVPMLTYKKIHFVYKKDTALVCHTLPFCKIWRRHDST